MEVKIPKEITNYKEKLFLNLTIRQVLSLIAALGTMVPLYFYLVYSWHWDSGTVGWIIMILGMPIFGIGYFSYNGMTLEKFIFQFVKTSIIYPQKRVFRVENNINKQID